MAVFYHVDAVVKGTKGNIVREQHWVTGSASDALEAALKCWLLDGYWEVTLRKVNDEAVRVAVPGVYKANGSNGQQVRRSWSW